MASTRGGGPEPSGTDSSTPAVGQRLIELVTGVLVAYAEDPTKDKAQDAVVQLKDHPCNPVVFSRIRLVFVQKFDQPTWRAVASELARNFEIILDLDDESAPSDTKARVRSWLQALKGESSTSSQKTRPNRPPVAQMAKFKLSLAHYDGQRGRARRWWRSVKESLDLLAPEPSPTEQLAYIPLILESLKGYKVGQTLLSQIRKRLAKSPPFSIDACMEEFVAAHDQHSLDNLHSEWAKLRQRPKESVNDFHVRFVEILEDLALQDYKVPDYNQ